MSLEIKGKITFGIDKNGNPEYSMTCQQLDIVEEGDSDIAGMIDTLTEKIRETMIEEFKTKPKTVQIVKYSLGLTYSLEGPVNHTLTDFPGKAKAGSS